MTIWLSFCNMPQTAAEHKPIVHKKTTKFTRIQSSLYKRVKPSWRLTRGIDSRFRKQEAGTPKHPSIGYGSDNETNTCFLAASNPLLFAQLKTLTCLLHRTLPTVPLFAISVVVHFGAKLRSVLKNSTFMLRTPVAVRNLKNKIKWFFKFKEI